MSPGPRSKTLMRWCGGEAIDEEKAVMLFGDRVAAHDLEPVASVRRRHEATRRDFTFDRADGRGATVALRHAGPNPGVQVSRLPAGALVRANWRDELDAPIG